uniref:DNA repair metallo-beta-lactamase domain-containing protein n=1 Tax=Kalmanozyma brasiliensis (strain GHG001) TaxID=1365824 RepID=V5ETZ4_KALBG
MTNSHGYVLEYPRIRVDHFDQAPIPLPASLLAHRRTIAKRPSSARQEVEALSFVPDQTHFDKPLLYLLTHIHTDHLKGLDRPGITAPIYCSAATKQLLLKYERQKTRIEKDRDGTTTKHIGVVRPYAHLRVTDGHATARSKLSGYQSTSLDLLHPLPYNVPTKVQYTPTSTVTLTLIESNHMFGGTMFLIQGSQGAVLHTGDMRAEEWWCEALTRNPFLSPYLCWSKHNAASEAIDDAQSESWADHIESLGSTTSSSLPIDEASSQSQIESQTLGSPQQNGGEHLNPVLSTPLTKRKGPHQSQLRLRNIYLDTELLMCNQKVPSKQQACLDMVALMRMYPPSTVFFLNCWTWGYEDMLIVTAKAFGCKIHVDRFKYIMYKAARSEAPFLADIVTQDGSKTRFHACEKRNVCSAVQSLASRYSANVDPALAKEALAAHSQMDSSSPDARQRWGPPRSQPDPLLVYINPGQIAADRWPAMLQDTKQRLEAAQRHETAWPEALVVPIERHSTLPELQMFVGLFKPRTVSPNTILDPKGGLDYYLLHHLFGHVLAAPDDRQKLVDEGLLMLGNKTWSFYETQLARAREQAQARRNAGAADSTEAVRAGSASLNVNAESVGESIDAWQLERLSKLHGISFKGLMMQKMAGNLAAMLEIERWRRAAGIDEPPEGLDNVIEDSLGDTQSKTDVSVSSVDYDADHTPRQLPQIISPAQSLPSVVLQDSQPGEDDESPTPLTEDLASRYLNVLIHHFNVSFHRTDESYVDMWKTVRRTMAGDAQKVEEHWFRETGDLPPLWSSQVVDTAAGQQESDDKASLMGEILSSFIDMLSPAPPEEGFEVVPVSASQDRTVALQLILRHLARLGLHDPVMAESSIGVHSDGQSHASCAGDAFSAEWRALSTPLTTLTRHLAAELRCDNAEDAERALLSLQLAGVLFSNRPLNRAIDTSAIQHLLESIINIVGSAPRDLSSLNKAHKQRIALSCAVLRAEELDEPILAPFEQRLLTLVQDSSGPLMRRESLLDSQTAQSGPSHVATTHGHSQVDQEAEETSSRPPAPSSPRQLEATHAETTDSILASVTEHDTIESSTSAVVGTDPVVEASQASSATQEEDSTQSEVESLPLAEGVEDQTILAGDELLYGEEPGTPFGLGDSDALDVADLDTVEREVGGDLDTNLHRVLVHRVGGNDFVDRKDLDRQRLVLQF